MDSGQCVHLKSTVLADEPGFAVTRHHAPLVSMSSDATTTTSEFLPRDFKQAHRKEPWHRVRPIMVDRIEVQIDPLILLHDYLINRLGVIGRARWQLCGIDPSIEVDIPEDRCSASYVDSMIV